VYKLIQKYFLPVIILFLIYGSVNHVQAQRELEIKLADEYYRKGELEKALALYDGIIKNYRYIPQVHNNYLSLLLDLKEFNEAHKYLTTVLKRFPGNIYYVLDRGIIYREEGKLDEMDRYYKKLIENDIREDNYKSRVTAQYFINHQLVNYSIYTYQQAREFSGNPISYSFELANIYRMLNKKGLMVEEYLTYLSENPSNLQYVRNTLQMILTEPEDLEDLEVLLYQKIQIDPEDATYNELLIWVNLQQKNFNGAFIQARALDRRSGTAGDRAMNIGIIALQNQDYEAAAKIFDYIVIQYPLTGNSILARHYRIKAEEEIIKSTYPVDIEKIRGLALKYDLFIKEIGYEPTTLDSYRNKALLHAFYLDEKDSAIQILQQVISHPRSPRKLKAESKLDLGDIYILTEETWESTLLYSQVEKSMKETPTGYEAKLRNAKLSYYKGDFKLAQEHLDILKEATTREISNDAMRLSLLIRDNTGLDSTEEAMRKYSSIELMLFQNRNEQAKASIDVMIEDYAGHSLVDELLWLKADILRKEGMFVEALTLLEKIEIEYFNDILGDDAYYLSGVIYEEDLSDTIKAMEIYNNFLLKYPGSVFAADARKRFRSLRGDFDEPESEPVN
jgi:tetratricopeptide (TPR) repeat protein